MQNLTTLLRPSTFDDFVGQEHIIGTDTPLRKSIQSALSDESFAPPHCIFFGPPGSGKTTLARIIAKSLRREIGFFNATNFKLEELKKFLTQYENSLLKCVVFIDEIHRLSKPQQEYLLPIMEEGRSLILGASTNNPFFTLTNAIRSRCFLFEFKPLDYAQMERILRTALQSLGFVESSAEQSEYSTKCIDKEAYKYLITTSAGDARAMLNTLQALSFVQVINTDSIKSLRPYALHDGASEQDTHYNLVSALIKSIRGSDVNASVYYLARLIAGGEDAEFLARRLVILASEDIGNANPNALNIATSTMLAVSKIGYPEARIILSQCVIYLASSPKSNTAYKAINTALDMIESGEIIPIAPNILPHAKEYLYPHDFGGWVEQSYLAKDLHLVESTNKGFEKTLNEWLEKIHNTGQK